MLVHLTECQISQALEGKDKEASEVRQALLNKVSIPLKQVLGAHHFEK